VSQKKRTQPTAVPLIKTGNFCKESSIAASVVKDAQLIGFLNHYDTH